MYKLTKVRAGQEGLAMELINTAKEHLKNQGIDQWQTGYPDLRCIQNDIAEEKGYFLTDDTENDANIGTNLFGYLCVDFSGEPSYDGLEGEWALNQPYVVVHRMAFADKARGKGLSSVAFELVQMLAAKRDVHYFRVDTDEDNEKMKHVLDKNGFTYRGTIWFDNSVKIAYDKIF